MRAVGRRRFCEVKCEANAKLYRLNVYSQPATATATAAAAAAAAAVRDVEDVLSLYHSGVRACEMCSSEKHSSR